MGQFRCVSFPVPSSRLLLSTPETPTLSFSIFPFVTAARTKFIDLSTKQRSPTTTGGILFFYRKNASGYFSPFHQHPFPFPFSLFMLLLKHALLLSPCNLLFPSRFIPWLFPPEWVPIGSDRSKNWMEISTADIMPPLRRRSACVASSAVGLWDSVH